jgi:hypothetical protein
VTDDQLLLIGTSAAEMFGETGDAPLMEPLHSADRHTAHPLEHLLAGIYYFRLARSCVALWTDQRKPLLAYKDVVPVEIERIREELERRRPGSRNAWDLVQRWELDVEEIVRQRSAVDQVAGLPISGRDLRAWVLEDAERLGLETAPSANRVRRRLGAWFRGELRTRLGTIEPPQQDLGDVLIRIGQESRRIAPMLRERTTEFVHELAQADESADAETFALETSSELPDRA